MQRAAEMRAPQREQLFLKTCFGYANDPHSANCTAAQLRLWKGYCLNRGTVCLLEMWIVAWKNSSEWLYVDAGGVLQRHPGYYSPE